MKRTLHSPLGFTLIELVTVIALIAVAIALVGPRFSQSDTSGLLQGEVMVASLLRTARTTAIMQGQDARLIVDFDPASEGYLAVLAVVVLGEGNRWTLVAPPTRLPETVRVVPTDSVPVSSGVNWDVLVVTKMNGTMQFSGGGLSAAKYGYLNFTNTGGTANGNKLVLSVCDRGSSSPKFVSSERIRAFLMRTSGVHTLVQESSSL